MYWCDKSETKAGALLNCVAHMDPDAAKLVAEFCSKTGEEKITKTLISNSKLGLELKKSLDKKFWHAGIPKSKLARKIRDSADRRFPSAARHPNDINGEAV